MPRSASTPRAHASRARPERTSLFASDAGRTAPDDAVRQMDETIVLLIRHAARRLDAGRGTSLVRRGTCGRCGLGRTTGAGARSPLSTAAPLRVHARPWNPSHPCAGSSVRIVDDLRERVLSGEPVPVDDLGRRARHVGRSGICISRSARATGRPNGEAWMRWSESSPRTPARRSSLARTATCSPSSYSATTLSIGFAFWSKLAMPDAYRLHIAPDAIQYERIQ